MCFEGLDTTTIMDIQKSNKKSVGKLKYELHGIVLEEFVGLRPWRPLLVEVAMSPTKMLKEPKRMLQRINYVTRIIYIYTKECVYCYCQTKCDKVKRKLF